MKNHFLISESEKNRILGLHESYKTSHGTSLLNEQEEGSGYGTTITIPKDVTNIDLIGFEEVDVKSVEGTRPTYAVKNDLDDFKIGSTNTKKTVESMITPNWKVVGNTLNINSGVGKFRDNINKIKVKYGTSDEEWDSSNKNVFQKITLYVPDGITVKENGENMGTFSSEDFK